MLKEPGASRGC